MTGTPQEIIAWLFRQKRDARFEIKELRKKRSLDANAYAWALITEIANVMRMDKEKVYLEMLKHYGQSDVITVRSDIDLSGRFKYFEKIKESYRFTAYRIYWGSSGYDSREMAILIDGIIQEAQNLGIETLPPDEVERLKGLWHE